MKHRIGTIGVVAGLGLGTAIGMVFGNPLASNAQTTPTTAAATTSTDANKAFTPNTDPAHEAAETPQHAADEASGKFQGGGRHFNTDAAHEAGESTAHAAEEAARDAGTTTPAQ